MCVRFCASVISRVIGYDVLLKGWLFGMLMRESRYFSGLGPAMRMDESCCWAVDFSALSQGVLFEVAVCVSLM